MVRLWVRPDGSLMEQVFVREDPISVYEAGAKLLARWPGAVFEDYSNDAYAALLPHRPDGSLDDRVAQWRRRGGRIVVDESIQPPPPRPGSLEARVRALEARVGP